MKLADNTDILEIMPSRRKRLWLFLPLIGLMILVVMTTTVMSGIFLVYTAVLLWATIALAIRVFSNNPVLLLSPRGLQSSMTGNGKKAGLVQWTEITAIRGVTTFGFIKAIEIYTYASTPRFLLQLASDEAAVDHVTLLDTLMPYWKQYS